MTVDHDIIRQAKRFCNDPRYRKQILTTVWRTFGVNFVKAWLFRAGASLLPLLLRLFKSGDIALLRNAFHVLLAKSSISFGLFVASYFALFKGLEEKWIPRLRDRFSIQNDKWDSAIAGGLSAFTMILFEHDESIRRILGHYSAVRAFQSMYNQSSLYSRWGDWPYSLLFALSSGQIVYSFAKRPESLDWEYQAFLTRVTVIHPTIIQTVRNKLSGRHLDYDGIAKVVHQYRRDSMDLAMKTAPAIIGCDWLHPESTCSEKILGIWPYIFKMMFPVYGSLHAIPPLLFRPGTILAGPLAYFRSVILATLRSSSFMATFILIFQVILCGHRNAITAGMIGESDSFYLYGLLGFLAASSIMVEKSNRRVELSLYVSNIFCLLSVIFRFCQRRFLH